MFTYDSPSPGETILGIITVLFLILFILWPWMTKCEPCENEIKGRDYRKEDEE
jgi:hypothetical protein